MTRPRLGRVRVLAALGAGALVASLALLPAVASADRTLPATSLIPAAAAIASALITGRLLLSLGLAVLLGAFLKHGLVHGLPRGAVEYGFRNLMDAAHLYILGFTLLLLGMVRVMARSGGARGVVEVVARRVRSARGARLGTVGMGLLVFFDDYANCMLVGPTMRPLSDRYRVSREKLAYLVDCTAAPVSGLALISTWVGYETGLLDDVAKSLGLSESGYGILILALPLRFYCILTLAFVILSALSSRDFGPMLRAERRAAMEGKLVRDDARPLGADDVPAETERSRASNAALPILLVVSATLIGLVIDGGGTKELTQSPSVLLSGTFWRRTLGASENNVQVLAIASAIGAISAMLLPALRRDLSVRSALGALLGGMRAGLYAAAVLLLAWALSAVCKDLGTGAYLVAALGPDLPAPAIPIGTFLTAALIAFSTGTSWGTMAILIPIAVPLAHATGNEAILLLSAAAVLDGAIFGDHCSPISDTTLMSSIAASSDHMHHVLTQLPYAFVVMGVSLAAGYLSVAFGGPVLLAYCVGIAALGLIVRLFGRPITQPGFRAS